MNVAAANGRYFIIISVKFDSRPSDDVMAGERLRSRLVSERMDVVVGRKDRLHRL